MMDKANCLLEELGKPAFIIDLREARRPDAECRRVLNEKFTELSKKTRHISYLTSGILLQTSIRFVMYGLDIGSYSVHRNFDKLIDELGEIVKA